MNQPLQTPRASDRLYETSRFTALGHTFAVRTDDPELGVHLDHILTDLADPGAVTDGQRYLLAANGDGYRLSFGGALVGRGKDASTMVMKLLWHINQQVIAKPDGCVLVHAAAAEKDGVGVLLPAPMEAGKTTLVAGLVQRGFGYLTDEAAAIDPDTLELRAYPKPLSIDRGSWEVLAGLRPDRHRSYQGFQWQVPVGAATVGVVARKPIPAGFVVAPRYEPGQETRLERRTPGEMLLILGQCAFLPQVPAAQALRVLGDLVRRCPSYELTVGGLDDAVAMIASLLETSR